MAARPSGKVVKAIPKKGESPEEAIARVERTHPGEKVVDPPAKNGGYSKPATTTSIDRGGRRKTYDHLALGGTFRFPEPIKRPLYSGRVTATDTFVERDFSNRAGLLTVPFGDVSFLFQAGNSGSGNVLTLSNQMLILFNEILKTVQAQRLINLSNVSLANAVPAPAFGAGNVATSGSLVWWLNSYFKAALTIRSLESLLVAGDINYTVSLASDAVMQNLQQLEASGRKLRGFPIPQPIIDLVDFTSGVKMLDDYSVPLLYGVPSSAVAAFNDVTLPATIASMIVSADTLLTQLVNPGFSGGAGANLSTDYQIIVSMFALAYGEHYSWPTKGVDFSPGCYYQSYGTASVFIDTGTSKEYAMPNVTTLGNIIPIIIPKMASDDEAMRYLSLARYGAYATDALGTTTVANVPNVVGLIQQSQVLSAGGNANYTSYGRYTQAGGFSLLAETAAAAAVTDWKTDELDLNFWLAWARAEAITGGTTYGTDRRDPWPVDFLKVRDVDLIDSTQKWIESTFLNTIL